MKHILLIDVDSKIPNLALMKISTYHKNKDDKVNILKLNYDGYPTKKKIIKINNLNFDKTYVSIIFKVNKNVVQFTNNDKVVYGGTGYDIKIKLPDYIDNLNEDYTLYPDNKSSYGFITRGCVRNCYFCIVPIKEGKRIYKYRKIEDIIKHNKVYFLDNALKSFP